MRQPPLHPCSIDPTIAADVSGAQALVDVLVGVGIALVLFGLYYRFVLLRANERRSTQQSRDGQPPGNA